MPRFIFASLFVLLAVCLAFGQSKSNPVDKFRQLEENLPTPNEYRNASGSPDVTNMPISATEQIAARTYDGRLNITSARDARGNNLTHKIVKTMMRIDFNSESKSLEVTRKLFTHDSKAVLGNLNMGNKKAEKDSEIDKTILAYLEKNFILKDKRDEVKKLNRVGREAKVDTTLVFVEDLNVENPEGLKLQNTVFFESFADQTNLVVARFNDLNADLLFKSGDRFKIFDVIKK